MRSPTWRHESLALLLSKWQCHLLLHVVKTVFPTSENHYSCLPEVQIKKPTFFVSFFDSNPSDVHQWGKQLLKIFGPELILIISLIKTVRSAVCFWRRQPRNFENVTLAARRRQHFRGVLAIFLVAQLPPKKCVLVHKDSLASCQRCCHSVEPRALTCHFKQSNLSAWSRQNCRL